MPLGDSITVGLTDAPSFSVPYEDGYRGDLYQGLVSAGYTFNYVGGSPQPWDGSAGAIPNAPAFDLRTINQDNFEAYSGEDAYYLANYLPGWLQTYKPNIVLLDVGINNIYEASSGGAGYAETGLLNLVNQFVTYDPGAHMIVAQITPYAEYTESIVEYNSWIANVLVPEYAAYGISTVNLYNLMLVDGQTSPSMYANGINHPNAVGYAGIANQYLAGIEAIVSPPSNASNPRIITAPLSGVLDLQKSGAIVQGVDIGTITSEIATGYAGGNWNGPGITSTAAMFDSTHLTALGIISNNGPSGAIYTAFEGTAVTASDLLIKYTYYGDTNLDGKVDGTDYSRIDAAYLAERWDPGSATGWANGDFNYDGTINGSDFTLIDNSYNSEGAAITDALVTAQIAEGPSAGAAAVPEPASTTAWVASAAVLLGRRRNRGLQMS